MVIHCAYCGSKAVMQKSGLCLDCGQVSALESMEIQTQNLIDIESLQNVPNGEVCAGGDTDSVPTTLFPPEISNNIINEEKNLQTQFSPTAKINCEFCGSKAVMQKSGLCLDCGQVSNLKLETWDKPQSTVDPIADNHLNNSLPDSTSLDIDSRNQIDNDLKTSKITILKQEVNELDSDLSNLIEFINEQSFTLKPVETLSKPDLNVVELDITNSSHEVNNDESLKHPNLIEVLSSPELESTTPDISTASPELESTTLDISTASPELESTTLDISTASPELESTTLDISTASPELESTTPDISTASPELDITELDISTASPELDITELDISTANPVLESTTPDISTASPELDGDRQRVVTKKFDQYTHKSLIGIIDLEPCYGSLEKPGLFIISSPDKAIANSVLVQTIINNPFNKTALISIEDGNDVFNVSPDTGKKLFEIHQVGNLLLNIAHAKETKHLLKNIEEDIKHYSFLSVDFILINIYQNIFEKMSINELAATISRWQKWLIVNKKSCLWMVHGDEASNLINNKFITLNNLFNGLATLDFDISDIKYNIFFWHLTSSVNANIYLNLHFDNIKNELSVNKNAPLNLENSSKISINENEKIFVIKSPEYSEEVFPRHWEVVNSLDTIKDELNQNPSATVIFYINADINVNEAARNVLDLRKKVGRQVKIILREMEQCLRNSEEKLIINVGANLIIPHNISFLKFITQVYALQGTLFNRNIPNNLEDVHQIDLDTYGKSYLPLGDFLKQVSLLVDNAQKMQINSTLLRFRLNPSIPIEEIILLIKIKRNGDLLTVTENHLYLFLFQCDKSEITNALSHLILLPIEDLFYEQVFFSYIDEIRAELKLVALESYKSNQPVIDTQLMSKMHSAVDSNKPAHQTSLL